MSIERRGPEYVHAHVIEQRRGRAKRWLSWLLIPVFGIGLAVGVTSIYLPQQRSEGQYTKLRRALRNITAYHATEFRPVRDRELILREDWVAKGRRRLEYFGGQFVMYHFSPTGTGPDLIHEPTANVVRHHKGAVMVAGAPERLLSVLNDRDSKVYPGPNGNLVVETTHRKHVIRVDEHSGRPIAWATYFFTDRGERLLTRTELEYGEPDPSKLEYDPEVRRLSPVKFGELPSRARPSEQPVVVIGSNTRAMELTTLDINQFGDINYMYRSPYERPFVEVTDLQSGAMYSTMDIFSTREATRHGFPGEQLALRLNQEQIQWPITVKLTVRTVDPAFRDDSAGGMLIGTYTRTFERPTCFLAPAQWFGTYLEDGPLFDYLRTRHYRMAQVYQNMMRKPDGTMVDALSGSSASMEQADDLKKDPADLRRAIEEARTVLRVRAEFDAGRLPMARVYVMLAELHNALGETDQARDAVRFARGMVREGRGDAYVTDEVERAAKELGL